MNEKAFGRVYTGSTNNSVQVLAYNDEDLTSIVGRMVFMDLTVDNKEYRSVGTISEIRTENNSLRDNAFSQLAARGDERVSTSGDIRYTKFNVQATFKLNK